MTQLSQGVWENATGDLCAADGTVIVPKEKRQKTEVYSRIVGYLRPVSGWNKGKRQEFKDRATFEVKIESPEPSEGGDA